MNILEERETLSLLNFDKNKAIENLVMRTKANFVDYKEERLIYSCMQDDLCVFKLEFLVDENHEYRYHLERFEYSEGIDNIFMTQALLIFVTQFCALINEIGAPRPDGTKFFCVRYDPNTNYKFKDWLPILDEENNCGYFIHTF